MMESPVSASDDMMMVDDDETMAANASNTRRRVDLSEAVYIQIPMDIVELLHANDDAGLKHFMVRPPLSSYNCLSGCEPSRQDMSGTYITLGKAPPRGQTNVTLCIHGYMPIRTYVLIANYEQGRASTARLPCTLSTPSCTTT